MSIFYIIATPIGNLEDITLRALDTLKRVSVVYCEDTRVTKKLFDRYGIITPVRSYHQHSNRQKITEIKKSLEQGDIALVTDAGTPGIADPGNKLIQEIKKTRNQENNVEVNVVPIPGASAVTTAASVCGFNMSAFTFMGYVPKKKGRQSFFKLVAESEMPVILYEAPYRIVKTLEELRTSFSSSRVKQSGTEGSLLTSSTRTARAGSVGMTIEGDSGRRIVVCRELTKQFESIYRGTIEEVIVQVKSAPIKGEYVIVVEGARGKK